MFLHRLAISCALFCILQCPIFGSEVDSSVMTADKVTELVFYGDAMQGQVRVSPGQRRVLLCRFKDADFIGARIISAETTCGCLAPDNVATTKVDEHGAFEIPFLYIAKNIKGIYDNGITIKYKVDGRVQSKVYNVSM